MRQQRQMEEIRQARQAEMDAKQDHRKAKLVSSRAVFGITYTHVCIGGNQGLPPTEAQHK